MEKEIDETIDKLHLKEVMPITSKNSLKRLIQDEINSLILEEIDKKAVHKSKVKHWKERKINLKIGIRPDYMNKLTRNQCNAIIKTRASMLSVETNHKKSNGSNLVCRFCSEIEETQEHILQTCQKVGKRVTKIKYEDVFKEEASKLKEVSEEIIRVENLLKNPSKQHELLTHEWATRTIWAYALQQQQPEQVAPPSTTDGCPVLPMSGGIAPLLAAETGDSRNSSDSGNAVASRSKVKVQRKLKRQNGDTERNVKKKYLKNTSPRKANLPAASDGEVNFDHEIPKRRHSVTTYAAAKQQLNDALEETVRSKNVIALLESEIDLKNKKHFESTNLRA